MSPTIFSPGAAALKSRATRSGIGPAWPCFVVDGRQGRGWQATRPSSRISARTSSSSRLDTPAGQLPSHPAVPIGAVGILECLRDQQLQLAPSFRGRGLWPGPPFVKPGAGYPQPAAHLRDRRSAGRFCGHGGILRLDERVLLAHRGSFAKYAAAFFRNAFSISSSRFRRSSSRSRARSDTPSCGSRRRGFPGMLSPSIPGGPIQPELTGDLGDRAGGLYHHPGASSLNSGEKLPRFFPGTRSRPFR